MKITIKIFIAAFFALWASAPAGLSASYAAKNFCDNFASQTQQINLKLESKQAELLSDQDKKQLTLKNSREKRQAELDAARLQAGQNLSARLEGIEKLAKTAAQKQAVSVFKNSVDAAAKERKKNFDSAIKTFQTGLDKTILEYQKLIGTALGNFKNSLSSAGQKAALDCKNGKKPETTKQTFLAQLKISRETFESARKKTNSIDEILAKLKSTRNRQISLADENFKNKINQAAEKLKKELGKK